MPIVIEFIGSAGVGKSTISLGLFERLRSEGYRVEHDAVNATRAPRFSIAARRLVTQILDRAGVSWSDGRALERRFLMPVVKELSHRKEDSPSDFVLQQGVSRRLVRFEMRHNLGPARLAAVLDGVPLPNMLCILTLPEDERRLRVEQRSKVTGTLSFKRKIRRIRKIFLPSKIAPSFSSAQATDALRAAYLDLGVTVIEVNCAHPPEWNINSLTTRLQQEHQ